MLWLLIKLQHKFASEAGRKLCAFAIYRARIKPNSCNCAVNTQLDGIVNAAGHLPRPPTARLRWPGLLCLSLSISVCLSVSPALRHNLIYVSVCGRLVDVPADVLPFIFIDHYNCALTRTHTLTYCTCIHTHAHSGAQTHSTAHFIRDFI